MPDTNFFCYYLPFYINSSENLFLLNKSCRFHAQCLESRCFYSEGETEPVSNGVTRYIFFKFRNEMIGHVFSCYQEESNLRRTSKVKSFYKLLSTYRDWQQN